MSREQALSEDAVTLYDHLWDQLPYEDYENEFGFDGEHDHNHFVDDTEYDFSFDLMVRFVVYCVVTVVAVGFMMFKPNPPLLLLVCLTILQWVNCGLMAMTLNAYRDYIDRTKKKRVFFLVAGTVVSCAVALAISASMLVALLGSGIFG